MSVSGKFVNIFSNMDFSFLDTLTLLRGLYNIYIQNSDRDFKKRNFQIHLYEKLHIPFVNTCILDPLYAP